MNSKILNRRKKTILFAILIFAVLLGVYLSGAFLSDELIQADFSQKGLAPSLKHPFGTDMLGRDMLVRTIRLIRKYCRGRSCIQRQRCDCFNCRSNRSHRKIVAGPFDELAD